MLDVRDGRPTLKPCLGLALAELNLERQFFFGLASNLLLDSRCAMHTTKTSHKPIACVIVAPTILNEYLGLIGH